MLAKVTPSGRSVSAARLGLEVRLDNLRRVYGSVIALDGLSLSINPGELVALLGPSGCGKTTALRLLAGLEDADAGRVMVGGRDVTNTPASRRDMGMVFQAYSLFPHLTAFENVAFGLRRRRVPRRECDARVQDMLELVGLSAQADRYPDQMSGGQQQRVALARALAIRPTVLLLDEPLAALDAKVRSQLRDEIRRIQQEVKTTTLFVTHDQEEALAIADRIGVMQAGRLEQLGSPIEIYARPQTPFVAEFVGHSNRLPATVADGEVEVLGFRLPLVNSSASTGQAIAIVRPEAIRLSPERADDTGASHLPGTVIAVSFQGPVSRVTVDLDMGATVVALIATAAVSSYSNGARVWLALRPDPVLVV